MTEVVDNWACPSGSSRSVSYGEKYMATCK